MSVGQKKSFPPKDKKNHSLRRTKKIIPSFGQKQIIPSFGTKKPNFGTKKPGFFTEKKKIVKHFWQKNTEKKVKKVGNLEEKKRKKKNSSFSIFHSNFLGLVRLYHRKYIFIPIFVFLSAGPFFLSGFDSFVLL